MTRYFSSIAQGKLLSPEEEIRLGKRVKAGGKRARVKLIEKNLRLVVSIAKR